MGTYRFGKYKTWDGYYFLSIDKKTLFGWCEQKTWGLSFLGTHTDEYETEQRRLMMESVDRLVKSGYTVI